jgi:hypothetical protein
MWHKGRIGLQAETLGMYVGSDVWLVSFDMSMEEGNVAYR